MTHTGFTSGEELLRVRSRDQTLLPSAEKVDEAVGSWMEEKMLESRLQEHHTLLTEPKIARKDQLATGEWLPQSQMVKLTRPGKFWHYMGVETDIGKCLYPEEAVYLIDSGELEVVYDGLPLSLQQAQTLLLQDAHQLDQYLVYSHLSRTGCKVVRHQPHLIFSKYEKDIRIDQHQASRKGTKLKVGSNKTPPADNSTPSASRPQPVDTAMEELYASLGDAAVNPLTLEKDGAGPSGNTSSATSTGNKKTPERKVTESCEEPPTPHEIRRRELIEMLPNVVGMEVMCVDVESADLLPSNSIPSKKSYKISVEALEYYSVYDSQHDYHDNQTHRNWSQKRSWNHSQDARWHSNVDDSNWHSRYNSEHSYGHQDRGGRWQQSGPYRDSPAMWREERNGRWGSADRSNWRHRNDPEPDGWYGDRRGGPGYSSGFRDRYSDGPQPQQEDQIDYSVRPEWKRRRRRRFKQQGRDKYPSCIVKLKTRVNSWKEYKKAVAEMNAKKQLTAGGTRVLWEGRTTPLLPPSSSSSSASSSTLLSSCSLDAGVLDMSALRDKIPKEEQLEVLYDVYLPTVTYKKTSPPSPNKRVVVMRDSSTPNPGQILEVTSRFVDGVATVCAVVMDGEVRLYTLSPITLPPPQPLT